MVRMGKLVRLYTCLEGITLEPWKYLFIFSVGDLLLGRITIRSLFKKYFLLTNGTSNLTKVYN